MFTQVVARVKLEKGIVDEKGAKEVKTVKGEKKKETEEEEEEEFSHGFDAKRVNEDPASVGVDINNDHNDNNRFSNHSHSIEGDDVHYDDDDNDDNHVGALRREEKTKEGRTEKQAKKEKEKEEEKEKEKEKENRHPLICQHSHRRYWIHPCQQQ